MKGTEFARAGMVSRESRERAGLDSPQKPTRATPGK